MAITLAAIRDCLLPGLLAVTINAPQPTEGVDMVDVLTVLNMFEEEARKLREKHRKHTMADPMILGYKPAAEIIERTVQKILDEIQKTEPQPKEPEYRYRPQFTYANPVELPVTPREKDRLSMQDWYNKFGSVQDWYNKFSGMDKVFDKVQETEPQPRDLGFHQRVMREWYKLAGYLNEQT